MEERGSAESLEGKQIYKRMKEDVLERQRLGSEKAALEGLRFFLMFLGLAAMASAVLYRIRGDQQEPPSRLLLLGILIAWVAGGIYFFLSEGVEGFSSWKGRGTFVPPGYGSFFETVKKAVPEGESILLVIKNPQKFHDAFMKRWPSFLQQASYLLYPRRLFLDQSRPSLKRFSMKHARKMNIQWILLVTDDKNFECIRVPETPAVQDRNEERGSR